MQHNQIVFLYAISTDSLRLWAKRSEQEMSVSHIYHLHCLQATLAVRTSVYKNIRRFYAWLSLSPIIISNSLGFNNGSVKQSFFSACNCIYANAKQLDEIMHHTLQESYCLSILTYCCCCKMLDKAGRRT